MGWTGKLVWRHGERRLDDEWVVLCLHLKCPQIPCVTCLVTSQWHSWEETAKWKEVRSAGACLQRGQGPWFLPLCACFLDTGRSAALPCHGSEAMEPTDQGLKPPKPRANSGNLSQ